MKKTRQYRGLMLVMPENLILDWGLWCSDRVLACIYMDIGSVSNPERKTKKVVSHLPGLD